MARKSKKTGFTLMAMPNFTFQKAQERWEKERAEAPKSKEQGETAAKGAAA